MALVELPMTNQNAAFTFSTDLDGITYNFKFRWNGRMEQWKFDLLDADLSPIINGVPFIVEVDLLAQIVKSGRPAGQLVALNLKDTFVNADRFSIGGDVGLYYNEVSV